MCDKGLLPPTLQRVVRLDRGPEAGGVVDTSGNGSELIGETAHTQLPKAMIKSQEALLPLNKHVVGLC